MEAVGLGLFMVSACLFTTLIEYPGSPVSQAIADPFLRRLLIGLAMGLTAVGIIYSPWGQRSGAHLNPSVTLTFFRLGKVEPSDALFYMLAQFAGGMTGVLLAARVLGGPLADPSVQYAATVPGPGGAGVAFVAEAATRSVSWPSFSPSRTQSASRASRGFLPAFSWRPTSPSRPRSPG